METMTLTFEDFDAELVARPDVLRELEEELFFLEDSTSCEQMEKLLHKLQRRGDLTFMFDLRPVFTRCP